MIPDLSQSQRLHEAFTRRFPVSVSGIPAGIAWSRPSGLVLPPRTPATGRFAGRRNSPTLWATWARERALGSTVTLRTSVRGLLETFDLGGSTMEAIGYLTWIGHGDQGNEGPAVIEARAMLGWVRRVYGLQQEKVTERL